MALYYTYYIFMHLFNKKIPIEKKVPFALKKIEGIGYNTSINICYKLGISTELKFKDLKDIQVTKIRKIIQENFLIRKELHKQTEENIKKSITINSYRGFRHILGLPVRGQRSRTNSRTQKRLYNKRFKVHSNTNINK